MATRYWRGTTTAWGTAGNWSGATAPIAGDTVIFDGDGLFNCTTDLDPNIDDLARLIVEPGFTGELGQSGGPLKIVSNITILRGQGRVYLQAEFTGGGANLDDVVIESPNSDGIFLSDDGTDLITRLAILSGTVSLAANMVAQPFVEILRSPTMPVPTVTINSSANAIAALNVAAGTVTSARAVTAYTQSGGVVTHSTGAFSATHLKGGTLRYDATDTMAGNTIIEAGATLDVSAMRALTITNLYQHPDGILLKPSDNSLITITNEFLYGQSVVN